MKIKLSLCVFVCFFAIKANAQTITEYSLPAGCAPYILTVGPDGNLWVPCLGTGNILRISTAGTVDSFSGGANLLAGVTGPDGNIWFADGGADQILKVTTSGSVTSFNIPTGGEFPLVITTGPDNNLWFGRLLAPRLTRLTTSGVMTEFTYPSLPAVVGVVSGPDNNLWVSFGAGQLLGKINTNGVLLATYSPLTAGGQFSAGTLGADGNIWFTVLVTRKIAKITQEGQVSETAVSGTGEFGAIATGPEGAPMFFVDINENRIGQISYAGNILSFTTISTASSGLVGIVAGPDDNVWFTMSSIDKIGKLVPNYRVSVDTDTLSSARAGTAYSSSLSASGGTAPYTWSITSGSLPAGLTLSTAGEISGTPSTSGTYNFTVKATDAELISRSKELQLTVAPPNLADLTVTIDGIRVRRKKLSVDITVQNVGLIASTRTNLIAGFSSDGTQINETKLFSSRRVRALSPSELQRFTVSYRQHSAGLSSQFVTACVDCRGSVSEISESNNRTSIAVSP